MTTTSIHQRAVVRTSLSIFVLAAALAGCDRRPTDPTPPATSSTPATTSAPMPDASMPPASAASQ